MTQEPCIAVSIWQLAVAIHPVTDTAQQRHALDQTLRRELAKIEDDGLRAHAAEIVRQLRRQKLNIEPDQRKITELEDRITAMESRWNSVFGSGVEITSIKRGGQ